MSDTSPALVSMTVQEIHSYDCPCIVALPIIDGKPEFIEWIHSETIHL